MTLNDLIRKAKEVGDQFHTYKIPLVDECCIEIEDIDFFVGGNNEDGYYIQMAREDE